MNEFSSNSKFANDIMHFVMKYYEIDWSPPESGLGQRLPLLRFTNKHAKSMSHILKFEKHYWTFIENCPTFSEMNESKFLRASWHMEDAFMHSTRNIHNFLFFSSLVAVLAVYSMYQGLPDAPEYAVAIIEDAISSFDVWEGLCRGDSSNVSSRTIM